MEKLLNLQELAEIPKVRERQYWVGFSRRNGRRGEGVLNSKKRGKAIPDSAFVL
jgi:hypothetical protein